jgi:integrase
LQMITNSVLKYAVAQGWCSSNVMDRVDREPVSYDPADYDFYQPDEITTLLDCTTNRRDRTIYAIAAYAGLRCGEILALRWADIDFQQARIIVRGNISYGKLVTPKGGRQRIVPLQPKLAVILADYQRGGKTGLIFPGVNQGEYHDPSTLRRRFRADVKRAGLRPLPLHSLRHSFGSVAVNVASLVQVRDWLGHRDLRTTSRYLHSKSAVSDAELLGGAF